MNVRRTAVTNGDVPYMMDNSEYVRPILLMYTFRYGNKLATAENNQIEQHLVSNKAIPLTKILSIISNVDITE